MKTIRQLFRQPLKTLMGIVLMTLAAAIVCLCVGQAMAARSTKEMLDQRFSTVGIPLMHEGLNGEMNADSFRMDDEMLTWVENMTAKHPDIVRGIAKHGILSAYIPELIPYNPTIEHYRSTIDIQLNDGSDTKLVPYSQFQASPYNMPYSSAMLVITLDSVYQPSERWEQVFCNPVLLARDDFSSQEEYNDYYASLESMRELTGYAVELVGTVTQVVSLQEGYRDIVGRTAHLCLYVPTLEAFAAMNLVPGEQYIVYGMDFVDTHMELVGLFDDLDLVDREKIDPYNPELLYVLTPEEVEENYGHFVATYDGKLLSHVWYNQLNSIFMSIRGPASLIQYDEIRGADGYLQDLVEKTQYTITNANGETLTLSKEEYAQRYQIPTIARLEGSVEDFLDTQEGAAWKAALAQSQINNQAFAVIGVDKMDYLTEFSLKRSEIAEGRDFTTEELANGKRVCIIHELVALNAGLQIGDTITLNLYSTDNNLPYQSFREDGKGILNPTASFYFGTTPFMETAEYTIVGIFRGEKWPDVKVDPYAFSANTVFVPKSSVQTPMEEFDGIIFNTLILENGKIEAFHGLATKAGYAGRFHYNDQNYSTIAANFHNYDSLARQMLTIGVVLYAVLLLLFLLLFPGSQKKNVRTMQTSGANFFRRFGHITVSSLGIVIPASLLGGWIGKLLWSRLVAALQTTAESTIALEIEPGTLTAVAVTQLLFALITTICAALFVAASRRISRRR